MTLALNIREFRKSPLLRLIALLFLLHSGADILFPQLCSEDQLFSTSVNSSDAKNQLPEDQPSDQQPRDEDCFCCCTHVMPSPVFASPDNVELAPSRNMLARIFIPSAPSDNPYHPPRLA